jgi:hypothetical protein
MMSTANSERPFDSASHLDASRMIVKLLIGLAAFLLIALTSSPAAVATSNPNPTDWTFSYSELFHSQFGEVLALRVGQHDFHTLDGFGKRHILDGHTVITDSSHIDQALRASCERRRNPDGSTNNVECHSSTTEVVYDPKLPAPTRHCNYECDLPVGVITAYYR